MRVPNLHTAPKRHLIKIRTFVKKIFILFYYFIKTIFIHAYPFSNSWKIDSYLEKYKFARRFEGLGLDQISWNFAQQ